MTSTTASDTPAPRPRSPRIGAWNTIAWRAAPEVVGRVRVVGLDGVRAIAVVLVMLFHLTPDTTIGGYLGVDLFFVVSGFLITSLLLRERAATGRISLAAFWSRRARRLLPALAVLLLVCCSAAAIIGGDVLVGLGGQLIGAATFSSNWLMIAGHSTYFGDAAPELFRNLWSLAVEEQFYLVWPLLLVLVLLRMPRGLRIALVALLAAASAVAMAVLWTPADSTRVYYGTDTHAFGLAIGAVLALVSASWPTRLLEWSRRSRRIVAPIGPVALAGLLALAVVMPGDSVVAFRGGLVAVAVLTAAVIACLLVPGAPLGRFLDLGPFRWVGARSYGLYLWHWPVFVLVTDALPDWPRDGASGWALGGIALAVTVVAAALSYRFVEQPVRRLGFGGALRAFATGWRRSTRRVVATVSAVALILAAAGGTAVAVASAPAAGQTQLAVQAGEQAIRDAGPTDPPPAPDTPAPTADPATGPEITAIGDSVMLAAAPDLEERFPGIAIDAAVSRPMRTAPGIVEADAGAGTLRPVVVLGLATNGPIARDTLEQVRSELGPQRQLVVINVQAPRGWTDRNNVILSDFAKSYRNVELADWHAAAQPILSDLNRDQIHFGPTGARVFTDTVQAALKKLADQPPPPPGAGGLRPPIPR